MSERGNAVARLAIWEAWDAAGTLEEKRETIRVIAAEANRLIERFMMIRTEPPARRRRR